MTPKVKIFRLTSRLLEANQLNSEKAKERRDGDHPPFFTLADP